eukprot:sb/3463665/
MWGLLTDGEGVDTILDSLVEVLPAYINRSDYPSVTAAVSLLCTVPVGYGRNINIVIIIIIIILTANQTTIYHSLEGGVLETVPVTMTISNVLTDLPTTLTCESSLLSVAVGTGVVVTGETTFDISYPLEVSMSGGADETSSDLQPASRSSPTLEGLGSTCTATISTTTSTTLDITLIPFDLTLTGPATSNTTATLTCTVSGVESVEEWSVEWSVGSVVEQGNWTGLESHYVVDMEREDRVVTCSVVPVDGIQSYSAEHSISFIDLNLFGRSRVVRHSATNIFTCKARSPSSSLSYSWFVDGVAVTTGIETDDTSSYLTVTATQDAGTVVNVRCEEGATELTRTARFTVVDVSGIVDQLGYLAGSDPILNCTWTSAENADLTVTWYNGFQTVEGGQQEVSWTAVEKEKLITLTGIIYIKTDTIFGSSTSLKINAYAASEVLIGTLEIMFYSTPTYSFSSCGSFKTFTTAVPTATEKVWEISKTDSALTVSVIRSSGYWLLWVVKVRVVRRVFSQNLVYERGVPSGPLERFRKFPILSRSLVMT